MEFRKVTISLPKTLYAEGMSLVDMGLFSNFSDLIRSGIREELKELNQITDDFEQRHIYNDKKLIAGVKKAEKEIKEGKGIVLKTKKDIDRFFENL